MLNNDESYYERLSNTIDQLTQPLQCTDKQMRKIKKALKQLLRIAVGSGEEIKEQKLMIEEGLKKAGIGVTRRKIDGERMESAKKFMDALLQEQQPSGCKFQYAQEQQLSGYNSASDRCEESLNVHGADINKKLRGADINIKPTNHIRSNKREVKRHNKTLSNPQKTAPHSYTQIASIGRQHNSGHNR